MTLSEKGVLLCFFFFGLFLISLQWWTGWLFLVAGVLLLLFARREFRRDMLLVAGALVFLGLTPISTDVSWSHMLAMGGMVVLAILVPWGFSHLVHRDNRVRIPFHHGRNWFRAEVLYLLTAVTAAYLVLPPYWRTGSAHNWTVELSGDFLARLFIGINGLVILEELLFVGILLEIFRRWMPFRWANLVQAGLFTTFLYQLGFTGFWGPFLIFPFTFAQGYAFRKTGSMLYVIVVHVVLDIVLYLSLINVHHPSWFPIFMT